MCGRYTFRKTVVCWLSEKTFEFLTQISIVAVRFALEKRMATASEHHNDLRNA
jgi:hypothetical protein